MENRTDFNADYIIEKLYCYDFLKDKISVVNDMLIIRFHKYFEIKFGDDYCEFFNTHCHPSDNKEVLEIINELINEESVFYHRYRFPFWQKIYNKSDLPQLLKTKNKKSRRVYSAVRIYIDD